MDRPLQDTCVCDRCHKRAGSHWAQGRWLCGYCFRWYLLALVAEAYDAR